MRSAACPSQRGGICGSRHFPLSVPLGVHQAPEGDGDVGGIRALALAGAAGPAVAGAGDGGVLHKGEIVPQGGGGCVGQCVGSTPRRLSRSLGVTPSERTQISRRGALYGPNCWECTAVMDARRGRIAAKNRR